MRRVAPLVMPLLAACASSDGIGTREQTTLGDALQVVQATAVIAEIAAHGVLAEPEVEPLCPVVSRVQGFATLDYGDGCVPDSGLVPAGMAGSVRVDIGDRVTTDLDGLFVGGVAIDGDLDARATPVSSFDTTLKLDQVDPDAVVVSVAVGLGQAPPYGIHGDAQRNEAGVGVPVTFDEVVLPTDGDCLAPSSGSITIEQGLYDVTYTFADDGTAAVARSDGAEGELPVCEHEAPLTGG
jgi:hypothetical protein